MWDLYKFQPSFVLGFHGCDKSVAERVLAGAGKPHLRRSTNQYDWLGNGIYFWESSPKRAMEWAEFVRDNPSVSSGKVVTPAVVGAIIDLGYCGTLVSVRRTHLDDGRVVQFDPIGRQRCGSNSSMRLAGCNGKRSSTSRMYA